MRPLLHLKLDCSEIGDLHSISQAVATGAPLNGFTQRMLYACHSKYMQSAPHLDIRAFLGRAKQQAWCDAWNSIPRSKPSKEAPRGSGFIYWAQACIKQAYTQFRDARFRRSEADHSCGRFPAADVQAVRRRRRHRRTWRIRAEPSPA